jgi:hypothetical protein
MRRIGFGPLTASPVLVGPRAGAGGEAAGAAPAPLPTLNPLLRRRTVRPALQIRRTLSEVAGTLLTARLALRVGGGGAAVSPHDPRLYTFSTHILDMAELRRAQAQPDAVRGSNIYVARDEGKTQGRAGPGELAKQPLPAHMSPWVGLCSSARRGAAMGASGLARTARPLWAALRRLPPTASASWTLSSSTEPPIRCARVPRACLGRLASPPQRADPRADLRACRRGSLLPSAMASPATTGTSS